MNDETTSHHGAVLERVRALLLAVVNNGNTEFQHEMDPTLEGWTLFVKVMRAKAPPALAPAANIQIGLLGLLYTYRHAASERARRPNQST